jgi:hypothetical protein
MLYISFLSGLFFEPEDGGRNVPPKRRLTTWRHIVTCLWLRDWIYWLDLLTPSCTISPNHNKLKQLTWLPKTRSILVVILFILPQLPASELDFLIFTMHGSQRKHSMYCWQSLVSPPMPINRSPIVPRVCFRGNQFSDPLPSNEHGTDHIKALFAVPSLLLHVCILGFA